MLWSFFLASIQIQGGISKAIIHKSRSEVSLADPGRGVTEAVSAVGFCLGSGLFGSCNSD